MHQKAFHRMVGRLECDSLLNPHNPHLCSNPEVYVPFLAKVSQVSIVPKLNCKQFMNLHIVK